MSANILLLFHCRTNTGYAIAPLERVFDEAARAAAGPGGRVHYAYRSLDGGHPAHLGDANSDVTAVRYSDGETADGDAFSAWVAARHIDLVFAFDMPLSAPVLRAIHRGGCSRVIAYWGASISDVYPWYLRPIRRIQYHLARCRPVHFVFESGGMREGAVHGAGVPLGDTLVCRLGVNTETFAPNNADRDYVFTQFGIPRDRHVVFFSGHMETRKGVDVLIRAIVELVEQQGRRDVHLLLLGNQPGDVDRLSPLFDRTAALEHISFGGYRTDIPRLHHGVAIGVIASTGWDSFTMSAVELGASGVPLIVSDLPGLREAVIPEVTGLLAPAGDASALARAISRVLDDATLRVRMGAAARERVLAEFSQTTQVRVLEQCMRQVLAGSSR